MPGRLIQSLLIANRSETACRIVRTIAVHSDAGVKVAEAETEAFKAPIRQMYVDERNPNCAMKEPA